MNPIILQARLINGDDRYEPFINPDRLEVDLHRMVNAIMNKYSKMRSVDAKIKRFDREGVIESKASFDLEAVVLVDGAEETSSFTMIRDNTKDVRLVRYDVMGALFESIYRPFVFNPAWFIEEIVLRFLLDPRSKLISEFVLGDSEISTFKSSLQVQGLIDDVAVKWLIDWYDKQKVFHSKFPERLEVALRELKPWSEMFRRLIQVDFSYKTETKEYVASLCKLIVVLRVFSESFANKAKH